MFAFSFCLRPIYRNWILCFVCVVSVLAMVPGSGRTEPASVSIHSAEWDNYTNADGTGFAWDLFRVVFGSAGVRITTKTMPYNRAVDNVLQGRADAWVGAYAGEVADAVYPRWHYDADRMVAVFPAADAAQWKGVESLRERDVVWLLGYKMGDYLDVPVKGHETESQANALRMVGSSHVDVYLGTAYELAHMNDESRLAYRRMDLTHEPLRWLKLYLAFAPNERGRRFANLWDRNFATLLRNDRVAAIYERHKVERWPFERPRAVVTADDGSEAE